MKISLTKYLLSTLLLFSFAAKHELLTASDFCQENFFAKNKANPPFVNSAGILVSDSSGTFVNVGGAFSIGELTVVDPLLTGLPNNQSAFALRIPISFNRKLNHAPSVTASYFVDTATLIGQVLTGTGPAIVETVEVSVSGVTNFGFILNVGFFSFGDPGFDNSTVGNLVQQLSNSGFGINFIQQVE